MGDAAVRELMERVRAVRYASTRFEDELYRSLVSPDKRGVVLSALVQRTEGWHTARQRLLTASTFGTVCELDPFADAYALWERYCHMPGYTAVLRETDAHVQRGVITEATALEAYSCGAQPRLCST